MRIAQIVVSAAVLALIATQGFGAGLLVLVIVVSAYLIGAALVPVWLYARMRLPERPAFQDVELGDAAIPEAARAQLIEYRDALVARGFEPRGLVYQLRDAFAAGYFGLFYDRTTSTRALSRVMMRSAKDPAAGGADVEFEIRYEDDTSVEL